MGSTYGREPGRDHSGERGRAEGLPQQQTDAAVNGPGVHTLASLARSSGHALKVALVLSAPITAPLIGAVLKGQGLPSSELSGALVLVADWGLALGTMLWAIAVCIWVIIRLFTTGWHYLRPLHETLTLPAPLMYVAAFAPALPYVALGPWGGAA